MSEPFYGRCDHCGKKVANRHHALIRHIEQCVYPVPGASASQTTYVEVLQAEELARYCCADCADIGAYCQMTDRGITFDIVETGPIAPCCRCRQPMDLRKPHIAYEMMDQTEERASWLTSIAPHNSIPLAQVCVNCDGNITAEETSEEVVSQAVNQTVTALQN